MSKEKITDDKLYELVLETKRHEETRRDEISKYYTSLFTGMIAIMPIIEQFTKSSEHSKQTLLLVILSIVGACISVSWILSLKRIYNYIEGYDKLLIMLEKRHNQPFIGYILSYLYKVDSPDRVTKQTMGLPWTFLAIFIVILLYNLYLTLLLII